MRRVRGRDLLAGTSVLALMAAAASAPAYAQCAIAVSGTSGPVTNPSGHTVNCIFVNAATVTGNVVNAGKITPGSPSGIIINASTINGAVINSGTISVSGPAHGISVNQIVTNGITNSGAITAGGVAILASALSIAGGIVNQSTGSLRANQSGIEAQGVLTFSGGISNAGTITAGGAGLAYLNFIALPATVSGGIQNTGTIHAGTSGIAIDDFSGRHLSLSGGISNGGLISAMGRAGIDIFGLATFLNGVTNTGTIAAQTAGIFVHTTLSFGGGITSSGTIASGGTGIQVLGVATFTGGITNAGVMTPGQDAISVASGSVATFTGDIVNQGTINTAGGFAGIRILTSGAPVLTMTGNISNSGTIAGSGIGVFVGAGIVNGGLVNTGKLASGASFGIIIDGQSFGTNAFGLVNTGGTIAGRSGAVQLDNLSRFLGGITNSGLIAGGNGAGILVGNTLVSTFLGGITNAGTITGRTGILVHNVANTFGGHIVNSGNITGSVSAIDLSLVPSITIDQQGGTITGDMHLGLAGTLNVTGGAINGNVFGNGLGQVTNFTLGAGTFTYAAPFSMLNLGAVNFNSGTVFVDGQIGGSLLTPLDVNGGATVGGTGLLIGNVVVASGGTLMPGHSLGSLQVLGTATFNAGSFYAIHVTPSTSSTTNVIAGGATINGGTVLVTLNQLGAYNHTYRILTAVNPVTGTFAGATVTNGFFGTASLSYDPNDVFLTLAGSTLITPPAGASINQQSVANGINSAIIGGANLSTAFQNLGNLSGTALGNALTQLSGENNAGFFQGALQAGNSFLGLMVNPFLDGRFGNNGGFGAAMGFAADEPPALPQAAAAFASAMPVKAAPMPATFEQRFNIWGAAYGGSGRVTGDPVVGTHDTSASAAAFAAGIDYRIAPDTIVGLALAGGGTSWNLDANLGGGHSDMFQAGVYGSHHWGAAYVSGAVAYNFHDVTTNRTVIIAGTDMLQARFQANGVGARLEGGYRYATPWVGITPYAAAQVQSIALPNYGETATAGSNQFALNFASQTATTTRTELGAWVDRKLLMQNGALLTLYGRAAWAHDFGDTPAVSAIFQALPGSNFIVNGATPARDGALVTGAAQYSLASGWAFLAKFDGEFSSTTSIYSGSGMVKKTW